MEWKDRIAAFSAVLSFFGALSAPVVTALVGSDPPTGRTCLQLQLDYVEAIKRPELREQILPGIDGESSLVEDRQANYCKITPHVIDPSDYPSKDRLHLWLPGGVIL